MYRVCRKVRSIGWKKNDAARTCVVEQKDVNRLNRELKSFLLLFFSRNFFSHIREKKIHTDARNSDIKGARTIAAGMRQNRLGENMHPFIGYCIEIKKEKEREDILL